MFFQHELVCLRYLTLFLNAQIPGIYFYIFVFSIQLKRSTFADNCILILSSGWPLFQLCHYHSQTQAALVRSALLEASELAANISGLHKEIELKLYCFIKKL